MTPTKYKEDLRLIETSISDCETNLKYCSDEKQRKIYEKLLKEYQNDKDEFEKINSPNK